MLSLLGTSALPLSPGTRLFTSLSKTERQIISCDNQSKSSPKLQPYSGILEHSNLHKREIKITHRLTAVSQQALQ